MCWSSLTWHGSRAAAQHWKREFEPSHGYGRRRDACDLFQNLEVVHAEKRCHAFFAMSVWPRGCCELTNRIWDLYLLLTDTWNTRNASKRQLKPFWVDCQKHVTAFTCACRMKLSRIPRLGNGSRRGGAETGATGFPVQHYTISRFWSHPERFAPALQPYSVVHVLSLFWTTQMFWKFWMMIWTPSAQFINWSWKDQTNSQASAFQAFSSYSCAIAQHRWLRHSRCDKTYFSGVFFRPTAHYNVFVARWLAIVAWLPRQNKWWCPNIFEKTIS